jgi:predicted thioesterase
MIDDALSCLFLSPSLEDAEAACVYKTLISHTVPVIASAQNLHSH